MFTFKKLDQDKVIPFYTILMKCACLETLEWIPNTKLFFPVDIFLVDSTWKEADTDGCIVIFSTRDNNF